MHADAELDVEPSCLADINDDLLRKIASRLAESDLASAVALKRCSSRFKDLATPLVANAVSRINTKWRDAADKIGEEGAARIRGGLERNGVLTTLNLLGNNIRAEGAAAIAEALRGNGVLTNLDIEINDIGPGGAEAIAEALQGNEVLKSLNLWDNSIGDEGAKALASALRVNEVLQSINLEYNNLGDEGKGAIRDAVSGRVGFKLEM